MGLLVEPVDISKYEFIRLPLKEQWGVLVRADSQLAEKEFVTPEDLRGVPLLMVRRELVKTNWQTGLVIPLTSWKSRQHTT